MAPRPVKSILALISLPLLVALAGCQNYGFEELPSSVIRSKRTTINIAVSQEVDILFVIDNSRSMVGEQTAIGRSFNSFTSVLDEKFGEGKYRIAVITTGMESSGCGPCPPNQPNFYSCMNETGENGRFQDRIGRNVGDVENPEFVFETRLDCRVMESAEVGTCFYDPGPPDKGVLFVGVNGCGYERGLAPIRAALSQPLVDTWNHGFLRPDATLAVVVISDEEDCGEVGDVNENISGISGNICYYAANGAGPDGSLVDPMGKPYRLTPVREYYDFLVGLKGGRRGMVKFAAIVGIEPGGHPSETRIRFASDAPNAKNIPACSTPNCSSAAGYCDADPGTRYVALAELFGLDENGFVDTICQEDFSETLEKLGTFVACPREFKLSETILDPGLANILINDVAVPRYSCSDSTQERVIECSGPSDTSCSGGACVETWSYLPPGDPPDPGAEGGRIVFADHYDPCKLITSGEINIELVYVTM